MATSQTFNILTPTRSGKQDGEKMAVGLGSARWTKGNHTVPVKASTQPARAIKKQPCADLKHTPPRRVEVCRVDGPTRGLGTEQSRETTVAGSGYGLQRRTHQTPDGAKPEPANRSTHDGKSAVGCEITGVSTANGIPRLQPWEEVNPRPLAVCSLSLAVVRGRPSETPRGSPAA
jgi:hypothetical protein